LIVITPVLPTYARADVSFESGEGAWLTATDGRRYLDFGSGVAVNSLGHHHPQLVAALKTQAEKIWHSSNLFRIPGGERLAARLVEQTFADTVFFANSGAEALECAIKMARRFQWGEGRPERYRLITFEGAFHGRTLATIAAGGQEKYLEGFGPKVDGFDQVPFGDHDALKAAIGPATAGILIEPIQGEGGVRPVPAECLKGLRHLCDDHNLLLIFDEVQCGMGRTGKLFAHEWAGITPDIMAIAKAIGGGFPLGACLATERAARYMTAGTHGSTFGGNPLAMAVGNAVMDVMTEPGFMDRVQTIANRLHQSLGALVDEFPDLIDDVRGKGLLLGLKCVVPNTQLRDAALAQGLLTITAGDNVLRLLPPLNLSDEEIEKALTLLHAACASLAKGREVAA
jgi:acetylornithine/N-succinyldiaminopimelate aminotransferase